MIGFIGAGNMAGALMRGMIRGGVEAGSMAAYDINTARVQEAKELGVRTFASIAALCEACDTVVLAVKPKFIREVAVSLPEGAYDVLSIAVGFTQSMLEALLPHARGIAHAMPNTPALVGEGVIAFNENHSMEPVRFETMRALFACCCQTFVVPENLFDAVTGISGSGPAYVYMFAEALGDAGVRQGLPREMAYALAAQTLLGAGKMMLETKSHPGELKDAVTSPGGTTIEAVYALEKAGLRGAVMDAVDACAKKVAQMAGK